MEGVEAPGDDRLRRQRVAQTQTRSSRSGRAGRAGGSRRSRRHAYWPWLLLVVVIGLAAGVWFQQDSIRAWLPQSEFNQLLNRADAALAAGHLSGIDGSSARELYDKALETRASNARALAGLQKVGRLEVERARRQLDAGQLDAAGESLGVARAVLGGGSELDRLSARLSQLRAQHQKLTTVLDKAAQALAQGQLHGEEGAATLYQQVLQVDPDNAAAAQGLDKVGVAMAAQIRSAIANGRLPQAAHQLERLEQLLPHVSSLSQLQAQLDDARSQRMAAREQLLQQAAQALAAGRLTGHDGDSALARYRKVLGADPGNVVAQQGIHKVAAALLARAGARMDAGRVDAAGTLLDQAETLVGAVPQLKQARQRLADLRAGQAAPAALTAAQKARVAQLITRAQAAAESGKLMLPPGNSAYDLYRSALAIDAGNADAFSGLASLPGQARSLFDKALDEGNIARAQELLSAYSGLVPGSSVVARMRIRLNAARQSGR